MIIKTEKILNWPPTLLIPNLEKIWKDSKKSEPIEVLDTSGDLRSEDNIPRQPEEMEFQLELKKKSENDYRIFFYNAIKIIIYLEKNKKGKTIKTNFSSRIP